VKFNSSHYDGCLLARLPWVIPSTGSARERAARTPKSIAANAGLGDKSASSPAKDDEGDHGQEHRRTFADASGTASTR